MKFGRNLLPAVAIGASVALGSAFALASDESCAGRNPARSQRCIFPLFCDSNDECDCDRACCPDCGRKKPREKKQLLSCFACKEPPRGATAVSLPARLAGFTDPDASSDTESARLRGRRNVGAGSDSQAGSGSGEGGAFGGRTEVRLSRLESDLNGLTMLVEKLAESQARQERDLTNNTLLLEKIAAQIRRPGTEPDPTLPPAAGDTGAVAPSAGAPGGPQGGDY